MCESIECCRTLVDSKIDNNKDSRIAEGILDSCKDRFNMYYRSGNMRHGNGRPGVSLWSSPIWGLIYLQSLSQTRETHFVSEACLVD